MKRVLVLLVAMSGCLIKPDRVALSDGGNGSVDSLRAFVPRVLVSAFFSDAGMSMGMGPTQYGINLPSIPDGDLLLLVGNIDNKPTVTPPPGFQTLIHRQFGDDGQTYVVFWKIAASEPGSYSDMYTGSTSGAATYTLLAIAGAATTDPLIRIDEDLSNGGNNPASASSAGITTVVENSMVIYAAGADWRGHDGECTFALPPTFTTLTTLTDHGPVDPAFQWTTQMIGYRIQPAIGNGGPYAGKMSNSVVFNGEPWSVSIAVAPK